MEANEEARVKVRSDDNEFWLQNKYRGIKFVDKDQEPAEHRVVIGVKFYRARMSGALSRRRKGGWYVQTDLDPLHRQDTDETAENESEIEDYVIDATFWPMIRASPEMRAKFRFASEQPAPAPPAK